MRKIIVVFLLLLGLLSTAAPVLACNPPPSKNFDCYGLLGKGYKYGFKVHNANNGKYTLTPQFGTLIGYAPTDMRNYVKISNSNNRTFDWSASMGIDAVIVNAGGKFKTYKVDEQKSGKKLQGTKDPWGRSYPIDDVLFCYDYELTVTASAQGTSTASAGWQITKTVATPEQSKFAGESANFDYTVAVAVVPGAGGQTGSSVSSEIKIKNNTPLFAKLTAGKAWLSPGDIEFIPDCVGIDSLPYRLKPYQEVTCTATTPVASRFDGTISVTLETTGSVGGAQTSAPIVWSGETSGGSAAVSAVTVKDTNAAFGDPKTATADQSWTYSVPLACPTDPAVYTDGKYVVTLDNTATINETGQTASQSVKLNCYAPVVSAANTASYDAVYTWGITKSSTVTDLVLDKKQSADVPYSVNVSVVSSKESNFKVSGGVTVANPNPNAPMTVDLSSEVAPGVPTSFSNCASPLTIPAGGSVTCNYEAAFNDKPQGGNNVTVTLNQIQFAATKAFDFSNATVNAVDDCVTVTDEAFTNPLGTFCAVEAPKLFEYTLTIPGYDGFCGETSYVNTAKFETDDNHITGTANWQIPIRVRCDQKETNCTYTAEYWSTHGDPSDTVKFNQAWNQVQPSGPTSPFFETGKTWLETLKFTVDQSSPYYIYNQMAKAYIATQLNIYYGAKASPELLETLASAGDLLGAYATMQETIAGTPAEQLFVDTTLTLHNFNIGLTGPNMCPDCNE